MLSHLDFLLMFASADNMELVEVPRPIGKRRAIASGASPRRLVTRIRILCKTIG